MVAAMKDKRVLITGGTAGIGRATAKALVAAGAHVTIHGRDEAKADRVAQELRSSTGSRAVNTLICDLGNFADVRRAVTRYRNTSPRLDVILCNAGVFIPRRELTTEGHERTFATVHLGHFLLTQLLMDTIKQSPQGRLIFVTCSPGSAKVQFDDLALANGFSTMRAINHAKGALLMYMRELARRLEGTSVTANSMLPGYMIKTDLLKDVNALMRGTVRLFGMKPEQGAEPQVWMASAPELAQVRGQHFHRFKQKQVSGQAADDAACQRMWDISMKLVGLSA
jgi:NAD(P)-dependent dehydrogenase (short-subunit alcohol dehydrogenase family)